MKIKSSALIVFVLFLVLLLTIQLVRTSGLGNFFGRASGGTSANVKPLIFIGDSVGSGAKTKILSALEPDYKVAKYDAVVCRAAGYTSKCLGNKITSGLTVVKDSPGQALAIIELGYNDYPHTFDKTIDKMMNALIAKGTERVLWINVSERKKNYLDYPQTNKKLREAVHRWPQLIVLDWKSASDGSDKNSWFADGIHLKSKGNTEFANWIRREMDRLRNEGKLPVFGTNNQPSLSPTPVDYGQGDGRCASTFGSGATCMNSSDCTGIIKHNYCPGPASWKCCVKSGSTITPTPTITPTKSPTPTRTPTPTKTPTPSAKKTPTPTQKVTKSLGDVVLNFTVRLQGVTQFPSGGRTVPFKVKLSGSKSTNYEQGTLTAQNGGVWRGSVKFSTVQLGKDYQVHLKTGKHIQKRVCDLTPSETRGGAYNCSDNNITLTEGINNLDFSKILLLVGDIPSVSGAQSGVIDSYDISYILNHLGSTEEDELALGDLNFDGVIDTQDHSLIIQSLNIKYDDE